MSTSSFRSLFGHRGSDTGLEHTGSFAGANTVDALASAAQEAPPISRSHRYDSGGQSIRVESFAPSAPGRHPGLVVIHGAGGMDAGNRYVRMLAEGLAAHGFATFLVHYFDRTGTSYASDTTIYRDFDQWLATINDGVSFVREQDFVDADRLGVAGYSLGGYLSMAQAARDARIRAVVELAGGIDEASVKLATNFPPTLLVHGRDDRRVPFSEAESLEQVLRTAGGVYQTRFYPGEGHILSPASALDALSAGVEFLSRHLLGTRP